MSDCCKVVSAQAMLDEDLWDMEMTKHTYPSRFIPLGVIVTAFGTGSEMNAGAVITHEEKKIKTGIFGAQTDFAFLDPTYAMSVPFGQVISGVFDTLSHAMETYFGKPEENNLSDDINEAVMRSVIRSIRVLLRDPNSYEARSELAWASAMAEKTHAENRQDRRLPVPPHRASAGRVHGLQPRQRAGSAASRAVPAHLPVQCAAICPLRPAGMGYYAHGHGGRNRPGRGGCAGSVYPGNRPANNADGAGHSRGHRPAHRGGVLPHLRGLLQAADP